MNPHAEPIPEKFRNWDSVLWFAQPNDLIGGWCVMTVDKPPSQCDFRLGEIEVGCFMTEQTAKLVASTHNTQLAVAQRTPSEEFAQAELRSSADAAFGTPWELLAQWYDWWRNTDEAPVKMPDALHVRTAMALMMHEVDGTSSAEERAAAFDRMQDRLLVKTAQVTPPQEEIGHHRKQALILGSLNHADLKFEPCWGVADARVRVTHTPTGRTGYGGSDVAAMMNLAETWDAQSG